MATVTPTKLLIVLLVLGAGFVFMQSCTRGAPSPDKSGDDCIVDFSYSIGRIDSRFGISEQEVEESIRQALVLWGGAADSLNARLIADGNNTVRFTYDERQEYSDRAKQFKVRIDARNAAVASLQNRYDRHKKSVERMTAEHRELTERVSAALDRFNSWAEDINRSGGFTDEQMPRYREEREKIERLQASERQSQTELNNRIEDFNQLTDRLNREIESANELVDRFNGEFGDAFHFEGANYEGDGRRGTITVYHFDDRRELVVLLAHEIGHAIGLGHVPGSRSIMHETIENQLEGEEIRLSDEDRKAVEGLCS